MNNDTRCSIEGCEGRPVGRGWCAKHYQRWRKYGDPHTTHTPNLVYGASVEERFWSKVNKTEECWLWTASTNRKGYGTFRYEGSSKLAHGIAYLWEVGEVPEGLQLEHLCRVRNCVRVAHLEAVTPGENSRRGEAWKIHGMKTHCPLGHEYSEENTYRYRGGRHCKTCNRQRAAEYKSRKRDGRTDDA